MPVRDNYDSREAARLASLKVHMVDYLCRTGIVRPSKLPAPGRGKRRLYSYRDVVLLRAIARLLNRGLSVRNLKRAQAELKRVHRGKAADLIISKYLMTDGERVFLRDDPAAIVDLTEGGQLAFGFVLDLHQINSEVRKELTRIS